jgi:hypothetical protein
VVIKFSPKGGTVSSTAEPLQAVILGRADGDQTAGVALTGEWNAAGTHFFIPNVRVRFVRRGLWLHTDDSIQVTNITHGEIATFTMTEARTTEAPTALTITSNFGYGKSASTRYHGGFLLFGQDAGGGTDPPMAIVNAEVATATGYTSVADGGRNARNTNVLRYTPAGTTEAFSGTLGAPTLSGETLLVSIFANVRPSTSTSFLVRARVNSVGLYNQYTPHVAIPAVSTQYPRWVFLGTAAIVAGITSFYLGITASAASSSLDIDSIVVCDARTTQVLAIIGPGDDELDSAADVGNLVVQPRLDRDPQPSVIGSNRRIPYSGDAVIMTKNETLYVALLATGGGTGTDGDEWRQADDTADTPLVSTFALARKRAYLVPG